MMDHAYTKLQAAAVEYVRYCDWRGLAPHFEMFDWDYSARAQLFLDLWLPDTSRAN